MYAEFNTNLIIVSAVDMTEKLNLLMKMEINLGNAQTVAIGIKIR